MLKFLALVAVVAVCQAAPKPGFLHGGYGGYSLSYPIATSHSSRIDIHSKPIAVVAAPAIVHAPIVAAPIVKTYAPIVKTVIPAAAVSHSSRYDVHSSPIVTYGSGWSGGLGYGHGLSLGYGYGGHGLYGHY